MPGPGQSTLPFLFISALLPLAAAAEDLFQVYRDAQRYDAAYSSARQALEAGREKLPQGRALILPTLNLTGDATRSRFDVESSDATQSPSFTRSSSSAQYTLLLTQPLYRPQNWNQYQQAEFQVRQAEATFALAYQDLVIRIAQAYFDVLGAQDTLSLVRAQKAAISEQLAQAKRNFEVGTSTITDTREAQARFDLVLAQEIAAENDLRVKRLALDTLVGRTDTQPNPINAPVAVPPAQPVDADAWVAASENASPAILQAKKAVEVAELETEKAKAGHKPTLDLTTSYGVNKNIGASPVIAADQKSTTGVVGLAFNLPLFAGFATQNRIRETLALEEKARTDLEGTRRQVAQAVRTAFFGVQSGYGQVRALEAAEASSQSSLDANRLGYQVGVRINIDVLNAQSQLFQTKRDLAQARYNVLLGHLRLRQANGTLQAEDLARMNTLLVP